MRMRMALAALITALVSLGALPGLPARAAEFKYDFEGCQQGWEAKKGSNWTHGPTSVPSSNVTKVMKNVLYPDGVERGDALISKPHIWGGGKGKIKLKARWEFEWYPPGSPLTTSDRAGLETSVDGGKTWKPRQGFTFPNSKFPDFDTVEVGFDAPAGPILFRIVLFSDGNTPGFGIEIDDLVVPTAAPEGVSCKK